MKKAHKTIRIAIRLCLLGRQDERTGTEWTRHEGYGRKRKGKIKKT